MIKNQINKKVKRKANLTWKSPGETVFANQVLCPPVKQNQQWHMRKISQGVRPPEMASEYRANPTWILFFRGFFEQGVGLFFFFFFCGFIFWRNLNTLPAEGIVLETICPTMSNPTFIHPLFSPSFHYNRKQCQSCSLWGSGFTSSSQKDQTFQFSCRENSCSPPFSFQKRWSVKPYHFTCLFSCSWANSTAPHTTILYSSRYLFTDPSAQQTSPWAALTH